VAIGGAADGPGDALTAREREVLRLVADGLPNKGIAPELGISEHTAKFHVGSLLAKLGAGSRTEAVTIATRRGVLSI
jgi:DNA-binding NarL/FixJ family response regulator